MYIVMTGYAGDTGSGRLLRSRAAELQTRLTGPFLKHCREILPEAPANAGVFSALWELGEAEDTGLRVTLSRIPIRQETIEICEILGENPYELPFGGSVFLLKEGAALPTEGCVIGETAADRGRVILTKEGIRFLNRPAEERE